MAEEAVVEPVVEAEPVVEPVAEPVVEPTVEPVTVDWRESITDDDAKKFAESSTDINHLVKRAMDMRTKLSTAIVIPGKDASDDDVVAYQKALGIPASAEEYEFPAMEDKSDEIKANEAAWATRFLEFGVSKEAGKQLIEAVHTQNVLLEDAALQAHKDFAASQELALKDEWKGGDYDKNVTLANRAFESLADKASLNVEELKTIQMKDGRLLMDNASIIRLMAVVGREQAEGTLGPVLNQSEIDSVNEQIAAVQAKMEDARQKGDSKAENAFYQQELLLREKTVGNEALVGAQGRTV